MSYDVEGIQNTFNWGILISAMSNYNLQIKNAPIEEAVIDIDCDMPPGFELALIEAESVTKYNN